MIRTFRARVHLFSMEQRQLARADCLLSVEIEAFAASRWAGVLTNVTPSVPAAGRYLLRLPNGRVREIDLGAVESGGCPFAGLGSLPMP